MAEEVSASNEKQPTVIDVDSEKEGEIGRVQSYYDDHGPVEFAEKADLRLVFEAIKPLPSLI